MRYKREALLNYNDKTHCRNSHFRYWIRCNTPKSLWFWHLMLVFKKWGEKAFVFVHVCVCPHLCEDEGLWVAAIQAEDEADGLKEFLDAGAKLLLLHTASCPRVKDARLGDKLKQILQGLKVCICGCEAERERVRELKKVRVNEEKGRET